MQELLADDLHFDQEIYNRAVRSFQFFFDTIFSISISKIEGDFKTGDHIKVWCDRLQKNKKTATISARKHLKTTVLLAYIMWLMFKMTAYAGMIYEVLYMSYSDDLASEKIALLKQYVRVNPYFYEFTDLKPRAETIAQYRIAGKLFQCTGSGVFTSTRGKHPHVVIVDDPLKDPEQEINIAIIEKITRHFFRKVASLPKEGGELHVWGTPQDNEDLFGKLRKNKSYDFGEYPAIINFKTKKVLFPEMFSFERLIDIRDNEVGQNAFEPEYMCAPRRSKEGYFKQDQLDAVENDRLKNLDYTDEDISSKIEGLTFGALDIGKKRHPSHLVVWEVIERDEGIFCRQLLSLWLDRVDYTEQIEICKQVIENFGIEVFTYDNTRGEFETEGEKGNLPEEMIPVVFNRKIKFKLASTLDKLINKGKTVIQFIADERQKRQILNVDNDLNSVESNDGHGDSFWSNGLALHSATNEGEFKIRFV